VVYNVELFFLKYSFKLSELGDIAPKISLISRLVDITDPDFVPPALESRDEDLHRALLHPFCTIESTILIPAFPSPKGFIQCRGALVIAFAALTISFGSFPDK